MIYYKEIAASKGIDINKSNELKECDIFPYWNFLDRGFKFQMYVCNSYHDLFIMSINLDDISILKISGVDYHCIISRISKSESVNILQNVDLSEKSGTLQNINFLDVYSAANNSR